MDPAVATARALDDAIATAAYGPPQELDRPVSDTPYAPTGRQLRDAFTDMVRSRELDVAARWLRAQGTGYYTIASAGHEATVAVGALTRPDDPALLHYRDGALVLARARRGGVEHVEADVLASMCASVDDPASGGRHKVWGSQPLWIVPQTSTIASQLPKATGAAVALGRARRLRHRLPVPDDAIVISSFGDASVNHASALTAINAATWSHRVGNPTPVLFVCEDNGLGISVSSPRGWVTDRYAGRRGLHYVRAAGEIDEVWARVAEAVDRCRRGRLPVLLHLETVRLWGHAGSDVESAYRDPGDIRADVDRDPLPHTARRLCALGLARPEELAGEVEAIRRRTATLRETVAAGATPLPDAAAVTAPLNVHRPERVRVESTRMATDTVRAELFPRGLPEDAASPQRRTLAAHLNAALHDLLAAQDETLVFGEDVGRKGGVYGVTAGLQGAFGAGRVFDTLLDETSILGLAQGAALLGHLPIPEIQYLAYLHNAIDQLRGEAASTSFFSAGRFRTPMVLRLPGLAYQRGFGGHFHNEQAVGALREIPGIAVAVPARPSDGARLLRTAAGMAAADGRVVVLLEPIALYHERDLHLADDDGWVEPYPVPGELALPGEVVVHHPEAADVVVVTYGNGLRMSLRAARRLRQDGIAVRVVDLRWLVPLPHAAIAEHARDVGRVLVVDEARASGGIADAVLARLAEDGVGSQLAAVRALDSYVPLGPAAQHVLVGEDQVVSAARTLTGR